jgi:hypothetical protein
MLIWSSFVLLHVLLAVGTADALYLHLWRFRLFARPESRLEHAVHTIRALLVPVTVWLFYVSPALPLAAAAAIVGLDQIAMLVDVWIEPSSRKSLGGLPRSEYLIHVVAITVHVAALALAFVGRLQSSTLPAHLPTLALGTVVSTGAVALLHVVLLLRCPRSASAGSLPSSDVGNVIH